jgi:hypothetical protein
VALNGMSSIAVMLAHHSKGVALRSHFCIIDLLGFVSSLLNLFGKKYNVETMLYYNFVHLEIKCMDIVIPL